MGDSRRVLFVCLGNICRSPMAQAIFRKLVRTAGLEKRIQCESRGLRPDLEGVSFDFLAREQCALHGILLEGSSRPLSQDDADQADYILVADELVLSEVVERFPGAEIQDKIRLLRFFDQKKETGFEVNIPDPYGRGDAVMADCFEIIERACEGLLASIREREGL